MDKEKYEAYKARLKGGGVQIAAVPQLFETPDALAARMVDLAEIEPGQSILEPSAGRGAILRAILNNIAVGVDISAIEINAQLVQYLKSTFANINIAQGDFLSTCTAHKFDRIIMNPPFGGAQDIKHIQHAATLLKPNGRLVALCASGARQVLAFKEWATTWELLPAGTFKEAGTMVSVALLTYEA